MNVQEETTLVIIKPDATSRNLIGQIISRFEERELKVVGIKMLMLTPTKVANFYSMHKDKSFFQEFTKQMCSDLVVLIAIKGKNAVQRVMDIIGATDPDEAAEGTIRKDFGLNKGENSIHRSDALNRAKWELAFFFNNYELYD